MVEKDWFDCLTTLGLREHYLWLANLPATVRHIVDFGYWSGGEPFALLWVFDASEIAVIDINPGHIENLHQEIEQVNSRYPQSLAGRTITSICRDMTKSIPELTDQYYDLTFCENVLYNFYEEKNLLEQAVSQMIRITKLNGFIIAVEPKYGVHIEWQANEVMGMKMRIPIPLDESKDMSPVFDTARLEKIVVEQQPASAYCFRKIR